MEILHFLLLWFLISTGETPDSEKFVAPLLGVSIRDAGWVDSNLDVCIFYYMHVM